MIEGQTSGFSNRLGDPPGGATSQQVVDPSRGKTLSTFKRRHGSVLDPQAGLNLLRVWCFELHTVKSPSTTGESSEAPRDGRQALSSTFVPSGNTIAARLQLALEGRTASSLARELTAPVQSVSSWIKGDRTPGAEMLFRLADALGVTPRWLALEIGPMRPDDAAALNADRVSLSFYDVLSFARELSPEPVEQVLIPRYWLPHMGGDDAGIWLTTMPSGAMPEVAPEGATLVCRAPEPQLVDAAVYLLIMNDRPIVRRVLARPEGLLLQAGDPAVEPILITPDQQDRIRPVGRVLVAFNPV